MIAGPLTAYSTVQFLLCKLATLLSLAELASAGTAGLQSAPFCLSVLVATSESAV